MENDGTSNWIVHVLGPFCPEYSQVNGTEIRGYNRPFPWKCRIMEYKHASVEDQRSLLDSNLSLVRSCRRQRDPALRVPEETQKFDAARP